MNIIQELATEELYRHNSGLCSPNYKANAIFAVMEQEHKKVKLSENYQ